MSRNRSSMLIAIGAVVFVLGASLAFLAMRHGDGKSTAEVKTAASTPAPKAGDVTPAGAQVPSFSIPSGKQAVAVSVPFVSGVAGFVKPGDKVNLFGTIKPGSPAPKNLAPTPVAKLILSDIEVLYSSATPATPAGTPTTFVLALSPADAEQVVYFQSFEGLYLSLARSDQGILTTPGRGAGSPF